jgi:sulfite exporter TauE/SafE
VVLSRRLLYLTYLVIGLVVASTHHYLSNLDTIRRFLSAILAILLWPLILLGIDLHIKR